MPAWLDRIWSVAGRPLTRMRQIQVRSNAHFAHNVIMSLADPTRYIDNVSAISKIKASFRNIASQAVIDGNVPRIVHFVYGFKEPEYFPYYALLAVRSALFHNPKWQILFHYRHEPYGEHWESAKRILTLNQLPDFQGFGIARIHHYAHKSDVVRLLALKYIGGVYLDIDTLTVRSFDDLRNNEFVMAVQAKHQGFQPGLCNATMLASPNSVFVSRWLTQYRSFHSKGRDYLWDFHSVKLPAMLSGSFPDEITILDHDSFFYPMWTDVERILLAEDSAKWQKYLQSSYSFHLWNNFNEASLLRIDQNYIAQSRSAYAAFVRPIPNDM